MAITITGTPSLSLYPGIIDGRLPAGNWSSIVSGVGDASGNPLTGRLRMFAAADPPNTFCFSLTRVSTHAIDTPGNSRLTVTGFTLNQGATVNLDRRWLIPISPAGGVPSAQELVPGFPMMLGYRIDGLDADLEIMLDNNGGAGITYNFVFEGEFWLQEAGFLLAAQQDPNSYQFQVSRSPEYQGTYIDVRAGRPSDRSPNPTTTVAVATPMKVSKPIVSPAAAQDRLAPLRAELAATLAAAGLIVATIPGNTEAEIRATFQRLMATANARELSGGAFIPQPVATPSSARGNRSGAGNGASGRPAAGSVVTPRVVHTAFATTKPNAGTPGARPSRPGTSATRGGTVRANPVRQAFVSTPAERGFGTAPTTPVAAARARLASTRRANPVRRPGVPMRDFF